jgi:DNA-binding response OmpR family regulator
MPKKILIAEDDSTMVTLLQTLLKMEGFEVVTMDMDVDVDVPAEIRSVKPDILFMDVHLGQKSGIEIVESVRVDSSFDDLRIIMTSGLDLREECLRHGADGFLLKPFMPDDLLSMLMDDAA